MMEKNVSNTHFCDGTLVRLKKLLRTLRRLASICANGVTMRSSPWLKSYKNKKINLFGQIT